MKYPQFDMRHLISLGASFPSRDDRVISFISRNVSVEFAGKPRARAREREGIEWSRYLSGYVK